MPLPRFAGIFLGLVSMVVPRGSHAAQEPVEIDYEADQGCPKIDAFLIQVRQKAAERVDVVPARARAAPVRIALHASGSQFVGRLELHREKGVDVRELVGVSCEETASALAFVVALALLPEAPAQVPDEAAPESTVVESRRSVTPAVVHDRAPTTVPSAAAAGQWWAGVEGGVRTAPLPSVSVTERGFVELRLSSSRGFAPTLAIGVVHAGPTSVTASAGTTRVSWLAGRVSICPTRIGLGARVDLVPCLGMHSGVVWADGSPSSQRGTGGTASQPWVDALAELRADLRLTETVALRLGVEAIAVVTRYDIVFDNPNTVVFQMPTSAIAASLGVAVRIW